MKTGSQDKRATIEAEPKGCFKATENTNALKVRGGEEATAYSPTKGERDGLYLPTVPIFLLQRVD